MPGKLIYLMGPSGSGKDSLIDTARPYLAQRGCEVIRRVITRSPEAVGEDALSVSPQAFEALKQQGAFAMHWQANGLDYGIPAQLDEWLGAGRHVLVNGSRGYLKRARERYPDVLPILLRVDTPVLYKRLMARGRETQEEILARLERNHAFLHSTNSLHGERVHLLDNSTSLSSAVQKLLAIIDESVATST